MNIAAIACVLLSIAVLISVVSHDWIDAHFIHKVRQDEYLIGNNHGYMNGWTKQIFGRVTRAENESGVTVYTSTRG